MKKLIIILFLLPMCSYAQNKVVNLTSNERLTQLQKEFLNVLDIEGNKIIIQEIDFIVWEVKGIYATTNSAGDDIYFITLSQATPDSMYKLVLAHETIHIWQQELGIFNQISDNVIMYRNRLYNLNETTYLERGWESDAIKLQWWLVNQVKL